MFPDEPEGKSFDDLNQYLGAACPMGTGIDIKTKSGKIFSAFVNHSQESLPKFLEIFTPKGVGIEKDIAKIAVNDIIWFKLKRNGKSESYIDKNGIPTAKLPLVVVAARKVVGDGKIINSGPVSIYAEEIDFSGEITSSLR